MTTNYPGALDTDSVLKQSSGDDVTDSTVSSVNHPTAHNNLADAVIAVQTALGINPQGSFADVAARIANALTGAPAAAQTITATVDVVPLAVKLGNAAWTNNLFEIRNASNTIIAFISKAGLINCQSLNIGGSPIASTNLSDSAQLARLASPTFTGTPSAPTASPGTNTTQIATTAFVTAAAFAPINSPTFTGTPTAPTPAADDNSTKIATTAYVQGELAGVTSTRTAAFVIDLRNPDSTGNAWPRVDTMGAWDVMYWALGNDVVGSVYGAVLVPDNLAGTPNAKIRLALTASATGVSSMAVATAAVADTESLAPGSLTFETTQNVSITANIHKKVEFALTPALTAGDLLIVRVYHAGTDASDTLTVPTRVIGSWLVCDVT